MVLLKKVIKLFIPYGLLVLYWRYKKSPADNISFPAPAHTAPTIKLGSDYGGKHIPTDLHLDSTDVCLLAGAGEDISFDCALAMRFSCTIHIFDPTPRAIAHFEDLSAAVATGKCFAPLSGKGTEPYHINTEAFSRMSFHPWGLAAQDMEMRFYAPANPEHVSHSVLNLQKTENFFIAPVKRVQTILKELNLRRIALMKLDIEGAEYQVIKDMIATRTLPKILFVEFDEIHHPIDSEAQNRIETHIKMLEHAGMRLIATDSGDMTFIQSPEDQDI
jgi:FkbM family methyltransferase